MSLPQRLRRWSGLILGALACVIPGPAFAQNPAEAEALFEQARAAMASGSYDVACARFRDSDRLDPAVGTRFNLADCEERRGRVATAWSLFRGVASELAQNDDRKAIAEERAQLLEPRLSYLTLRPGGAAPPELRVRLDGVELATGSLGVAFPMDPGPHELVLVDGAGRERRRSIQLSERQHQEVALDSAPSATPQPPPVSNSESTPQGGGGRQSWMYVTAGVGISGAAVGTVAGIVTLVKKHQADANCSDVKAVCNQAGVDANRSGRTYGMVSGIGLGVGVAGLAVAAYLWLTQPPAPEPRVTGSSRPPRHALGITSELDWKTGTAFLGVRGGF